MPVDQEILLLRPQRDLHLFVRQTEALHQPLGRTAQRLDRPQQRRLLVERLARVRAERGRYAERGAVAVALDEGGAGRIPRGVAARLEGGAESARGETRRVGLADGEVLARKRHDRLAALGFEERVVLLGRRTSERQEPVGEVRRAALDRPVLHRMGDVARDLRVERSAVVDRRQQLGAGVFGQIFAHRLLVEDVLAVAADVRRARLRGFGDGARRHHIQRSHPVQVAHDFRPLWLWLTCLSFLFHLSKKRAKSFQAQTRLNILQKS